MSEEPISGQPPVLTNRPARKSLVTRVFGPADPGETDSYWVADERGRSGPWTAAQVARLRRDARISAVALATSATVPGREIAASDVSDKAWARVIRHGLFCAVGALVILAAIWFYLIG